MDSSQNVRVNIFGDEYSIKGDVDPDTTRKVAEYVDVKLKEMREKSASADKFKLAILTAMNIAGELFDYKSRHEDQQAQIDELHKRIENLTEKIEQTL
jgi:cell division protein ZapA